MFSFDCFICLTPFTECKYQFKPPCTCISEIKEDIEKVLITFETYPNCLFFLRSSVEKICTVPWSLATHRRLESWLKLMLKRTDKKLNFTLNI